MTICNPIAPIPSTRRGSIFDLTTRYFQFLKKLWSGWCTWRFRRATKRAAGGVDDRLRENIGIDRSQIDTAANTRNVDRVSHHRRLAVRSSQSMQEERGDEFKAGIDAVSIGAEALRLSQGGLKCGEAVLMALARRQGIESEVIPAIATGFCAGMGRTGNMCGAVTGAMMGLGLTLGRKDAAGSIEPSYAAVGDLLRRFASEFGSTNCAELLGCDIATEEGRRLFKDRKLAERCAAYTRRGAELAAELADAGARKSAEQTSHSAASHPSGRHPSALERPIRRRFRLTTVPWISEAFTIRREDLFESPRG